VINDDGINFERFVATIGSIVGRVRSDRSPKKLPVGSTLLPRT